MSRSTITSIEGEPPEEESAEVPETIGSGEHAVDEKPCMDVTFEILKNQRRRYVLRYLRTIENPAELKDIAEQVAAWENNKSIDEITSDERKRAYVGLYQCHLKRMDDNDIIDFNQRRGHVELRDRGEQLYAYLDQAKTADSEPVHWERYYLALAGIGGVSTVAVAAVTGSLSTVPVVLPLLLVSLYGVLALAHTLDVDDDVAALLGREDERAES